MQGKQASFGEEEAANWLDLTSLYLERKGQLLQQETSRSTQSKEIQSQGRASPLPFASLAKTFLAYSVLHMKKQAERVCET